MGRPGRTLTERVETIEERLVRIESMLDSIATTIDQLHEWIAEVDSKPR